MKKVYLGKERDSFKNADGEIVEYEKYFVVLEEMPAIRLYIKVDPTVKQILTQYIREEENR